MTAHRLPTLAQVADHVDGEHEADHADCPWHDQTPCPSRHWDHDAPCILVAHAEGDHRDAHGCTWPNRGATQTTSPRQTAYLAIRPHYAIRRAGAHTPAGVVTMTESPSAAEHAGARRDAREWALGDSMDGHLWEVAFVEPGEPERVVAQFKAGVRVNRAYAPGRC